jgi:hypothetical protein
MMYNGFVIFMGRQEDSVLPGAIEPSFQYVPSLYEP